MPPSCRGNGEPESMSARRGRCRLGDRARRGGGVLEHPATAQQFIYIPKSISKENLKQIQKVLV